MKDRSFLLLPWLLVSACSPRAALPAPDTRPVVSKLEPGEVLERGDTAIRLRFDRPMVSIEAVGPALAPAPVATQPQLPLRVHWEDTKTLLIRPELQWKAAQRYRLLLGPELARQLKPPHEWTIDAMPLTLAGMSESGDNVSRSPELLLYFNADVDPDEAAKRCQLQAKTGKPVALRRLPKLDDQEPNPRHVAVTPVARLPELTEFVMDCPGLMPLHGTTPYRFKRETMPNFTTHGPLKVVIATPASGSALPPEKAKICLRFSTPVPDEQVSAHVHMTPTPEGFATSWESGDCLEPWDIDDRGNSVLLAPRRNYRVIVDAGLTDVFGQQLGKAHEWSFSTGDRLPGLWSNGGIAEVFELGRTGHGVGALNLPAVSMSCARITPVQLATEFSTITSWVNEWLYAPLEQRVPAPWTALDIPALSHQLNSATALNAGSNLDIDLATRCGGKTSGAPGLYASSLEPSGLAPDTELQGMGRARLLANVTDLALVAKRGARTGVVWVTRFSNGALVPGATVQAIDGDGRVVATTRTDALGLARFAKLPQGRGDTFFSAKLGPDVAVVGTEWVWRDGLQPYQFGVRPEYDNDGARLFVHTDRGVYRPGERVLVHGLARLLSDLAPARPPGGDAQLVLELANNEKIERTLPLSDFGSFSTELDLPKHVPPGVYSLQVSAGGAQHGSSLRVAEFRPLTFELSGGPAQGELLAPDKVEIAIAARYLFGAPVPGAELRWTVERSPGSISPAGFDDYSFEDSSPALPNETPLPEGRMGIVLERTAKSAADGGATLAFPTEAQRGTTRYAITVEAEDSGHDVASRAYSVLAHSAERYPGVRIGSELYAAGEPILAEIVVVDRDGKPVAGDVELELRESLWDCNDPQHGCRVKVNVLETQRASVAAGKPHLARFTAKARGDVHVRALTRDAAGRVSRASAMAWVWWWEGSGPYNDRVAATLSVDKRRYQPGESARLALQTPLAPAHYLLTAERGDVLAAEVVATSASSALTTPQLALPARAAPNVFLGMTATMPRSEGGEDGKPRLVAGMREVQVSGQSRELHAEIVLSRTRFEPKQKVEGDVVVTHLGKPVRAEVALVAVNESVLQLTDFATPDPTKVFHAPSGLAVISASNVTRVVADLAEATKIPEVARLDEGGQDGPGGRPELRNDYVAAAYWAPGLRTDAKGRAHFGFDAPTDLSAYRLMAVVAALDDRVGSADARVEVQQPLSVHPLAPRFASAGDVLELGALVHDHTGTPGAIDVRWNAKGLQLAQASASLPASDPGGRTTYARAVVQPGEHASFDVQVSKGAQSDRVGRELNVRRPLDRELRVLAQLRGPSAKAALKWPAGIDSELSRLEITVDRVGLAPLAPLLATVLEYPYGCTEQTAAALSALAAVPELAAATVPAWRDRKQLEAHVADGIGLIAQARSGDGGFGLYPGMPSRPYLDAYVIDAALALQRGGFAVSPALVDGAKNHLTGWLAQQSLPKLSVADLELAAQVIATLASLQTQPNGDEDRLWAERARLRGTGRAHLLRALALRQQAGERRAALRASLREVTRDLRARVSDDPFGSAETEVALGLRALRADGGDPALEREYAEWLVARAGDPSRYFSTRDIAEILTALAEYARSAAAGAAQVELGLGGKTLFAGALSGPQVVAIDQSARESPAGEIWMRADGPVSVSIRRRDVSPSSEKLEFSRGLTLVRRYLEPKTNKPLTRVAVGDLVQVTLELRGDQALRMLALSDPLPAGFDPVDPGLSSGRVGGCTRCSETGSFDYLRRHDDRIEAFAEWLPGGTHVLRYLMRATVAGTFTAPGATIQPMYLPNLFGRSQVGKVEIAH